jgi:hypothetical protein
MRKATRTRSSRPTLGMVGVMVPQRGSNFAHREHIVRQDLRFATKPWPCHWTVIRGDSGEWKSS